MKKTFHHPLPSPDRRVGTRLEQLFGKSELISPTYRRWYASVISADDSARECLLAGEGGVRHPHELLMQVDLGEGAPIEIRSLSGDLSAPEHGVFATNSPELAAGIREIGVADFERFFASLPPVSSGNLFLDAGTSPRLVFLPDGGTFVAVRVKDLGEYLQTYGLIRDLLAPLGGQVDVVREVGCVRGKAGAYFLSRFAGRDFEAEILEGGRADLCGELFSVAKFLDQYFVDQGYLVRNLAPRNLIRGSDGTIRLIDYDNVFPITPDNAVKIHAKHLVRQVWFADVLDPERATAVFSDPNLCGDIPEELAADSFERRFFGKNEISRADREHLASLTALLERRSERDGELVFGHQLGRFLSDFASEDDELAVLRYLDRHPEDADKVRAALFFASRADQELAFQQRYGQELGKAMAIERLIYILS